VSVCVPVSAVSRPVRFPASDSLTVGEIPPIAVEHLKSPSPFTPGGMKSMGEGGCIGALAAVANAVADALAPFEAHITALPLHPEALARPLGAPRG
jgi:carbon-monoxide dehydrogenase large subunit